MQETDADTAAGGGLRLWLATGGALALATVAFATWDPIAAPVPDFCLVRRLTGVACPGCGLTRAMALLARGRVAASWAFHPGALLIALEIGVVWLLWGGERIFLARSRSRAWVLPVLVATAGALGALWVIRWIHGTLPV